MKVMSSGKWLVVVAMVLFVGCNQCYAVEGQQQPSAKPVDDNADQLDQEAIMQMCNESFHTSMEYLEELNITGTFPDETDKTPMCFIRCYLDAVGIIKDDVLNRERATEMAWASADDTLDECEKEVTDRTNPCEKAYFLTRCVSMRNIVDMRTTTQ